MMSRRDRRFAARVGWPAVVGVFGVLFATLSGCSFDSGLGGAECSGEGDRRGGQVCRNGFWVDPPDGGTLPDGCADEEICGNERDDDCDGAVDEGCPCQGWREGRTESTFGVCQGPGRLDDEGNCQPPESYLEQEGARADGGCGDGLDNDCDTDTDEGCSCTFDPEDSDDIDEDGDNEHGVCTGRPFSPSGSCEEPDDFVGTDDESAAGEDGEFCDGLDNDCDGAVDEGCPCTFDGDGDGDTVDEAGVCTGLKRGAQGECPAPEGFIGNRTEDESAAGANEVFCDGNDSDCDGTVDEGCGCTYDPEETNNIDTDESNLFGVCVARSTDADGTCVEPNAFEEPTEEESNCDGMDNDCDGATDEGCGCTYDPSESPDNVDTDGSNEAGICTDQTRNSDGVCQEPSQPFESGDETLCDRLDNDCDGTADEVSNKSCGSEGACSECQMGVCSNSEEVCSSGSWSCKRPSNYEMGDETGRNCSDGKDNDCDGKVDEAFKSVGSTCGADCECLTGMCKTNSSGTDVCVHVIFASSKQYSVGGSGSSGFSGRSGAKSRCSSRAGSSNSVVTGNNWKPVLSTKSGSDAKTYLTVSAPVYNSNGTKVADGKSAFWNAGGMTLDSAVKTDETGSKVSGDKSVWTGTEDVGTIANGEVCGDWSASSMSNAATGDLGKKNRSWLDVEDSEDKLQCDGMGRIYCINGQ